jgi:hypothetical protein
MGSAERVCDKQHWCGSIARHLLLVPDHVAQDDDLLGTWIP